MPSSLSERQSLSLTQAAHQLNLMNWPLVAISALFLSLRIFLKVRQRRPLWWDDYVLIVSWLALLLYSTLFAVVLQLGYGRDDPTTPIPPETTNRILILISSLSSLLILANLWSKTSFGITLLRLPLGAARVYIVCGLILLGTISIGASAYMVWVQCLVAEPLPWSPYVGSKCLPPKVMISYSVFVGYFSAVIDFAFVVLPWKMLWTTQMKRSEKVGITLAMSMGTLAGVAAIAKSTVFPRVYGEDQTAGLQVSGWGAIETSVSIMAASIPILRALVRQGAGAGVPRGYVGTTEGGGGGMREGTTGQHSVQSTFFQRTFFAPSLASGSTRVDVVIAAEEGKEVTAAGKDTAKGDDGDGDGRASVEMDAYGAEVRPKDFTV
ncbi:hypothetical protein GE09DRAFT_636844 [Coniochaeta sp. 2T2.1]|nr:hypothetical protein GE09DRAFT_636844 [Coniochaeta sp. 2T2.1]